MKTKPFDQRLHDACDPPARNAVAEWLKNLWYVDALPNPDKYAVDLVLSRDGQEIGFAEVEVLFSHPRTTMYVVTKEYTHAYWIRADKIKQCPVIEVPNRAVANEEYFYDVTKSLWKFVDLKKIF